MAYASREDLVARIGEELLVEISDLDRTGEADESRITAALEDASAEIDAYAQARYVVPFASVPAMIRQVCVDLALYRMFAARGYDAQQDKAIPERHKNAIAFLDRLSKGQVTIGVKTPAKDQGATVVAPDRIFTRDKLEGF